MYDPLGYDPFGMSRSEIAWKVRFEMGLALNHPNMHVKMAEDEKLPGELSRLAREFNAAKTEPEARAAANAFLIASEEYIPR